MFDIRSLLRSRRGLQGEIAAALGITHGAVSQWRRVPAERVLEVERITGVSRHDLRPDLYPREERAA
jgi:DNA-binding transcriptional regulator YdaS (Cro superfamily)